MKFFNSSDSVDATARSILGDLPEDPAPIQILQTVDQKAGEDVDPDEVVSTMRDLDDEVDAKLAVVEGQPIDQKDGRTAGNYFSQNSDISQTGGMELVGAVMDSLEEMDPSIFVDRFGGIVDEYYRGDADVDQGALNQLSEDTDAGDEPDTDQKEDTDMDDDTPDAGDEPDVDQKEEQDQDSMSPIDIVEEMGGSDARDTVENYAESVNKDPQDAAAEWIAENVPGITVEGYGDDGAGEQPTADAAAGDHGGGGHDRAAQADQMKGYDQKLEDGALNERIAEAVTSDEVIDEMAGAVAQKMADDEDFADSIVETVDQKGDFVTTEDTVVTAPTNDSKTVGDAGAITGGDDE